MPQTDSTVRTRPISLPRLLKGKNLGVVLAILFFAAYPLVITSPFYVQIIIRVFVYAIAAQAWNIIGGYAGQVSLCQAVFFGMGAFTSAYLMVHYDIIPWIGLIAGAILSMVLAVIIGFPTFRLVGRYFAIATMGLGEIAQIIVLNTSLLGGAVGIWLPVLPDSFKYMQFHKSKLPYYYIAFVIAIATYAAVAWLEKSKIGYYLRAIKADQQAAESLGIDSRKYKLIAFMISAAITGIIGGFYANYVLVVDPFSVLPRSFSSMLLLMSVIGGVGTLWGPLYGAAIVMPLTELTRGFLGAGGRGLDVMIYAILIIIIILFEPQGIQGVIKRVKVRLAR